MYHSIAFGDKNCYNDWFLIPDGRPTISPPSPRYVFDDIPGANGSLDLSDSLTGYVPYQDRTGSWEFYVENDHGLWINRYGEIMQYLHGKRLKITLEDDPEYYYIGRCDVGGWSQANGFSKVSINYQLDPFKYSHHEYIKTVSLTGTSTSITLRDVEQVTVPRIVTTRNTTVSYRGRTYSIQSNTETEKFAIWPDDNDEVTLNLSYQEYETTGTFYVYYRRVRL